MPSYPPRPASSGSTSALLLSNPAGITDLTSLIQPLATTSHHRNNSPHDDDDRTPTITSRTLPNEEAILPILQTRSRSDLPYTFLGSTTLLIINPLRNLSSSNEVYAQGFAKKVLNLLPLGGETAAGARTRGRDDELFNGGGRPRSKPRSGLGGRELDLNQPAKAVEAQPHVYDLAGRVWGLMVRRKQDQAIVFSGITNSGKSHASKKFITQILRLSSSAAPLSTPPKLSRLAHQVGALQTVLESFGCAKTPHNWNASMTGRYLELAFDSSIPQEGKRARGLGRDAGAGGLIGAKVLVFGLNKSRMVRLERDERTFHVFYQLLAGASSEERDALDLQDPTAYATLNRSGCYRLPGGPFSDDSTQFDELRVAMAELGFKAKHLRSVFGVLAAILVLGNLEFEDHGLGDGVQYESARVSYASRPVLEDVSARLGLPPDELELALTNETSYIRREMCSSFLDANGARRQRDSLAKDLYAILFAFVVESANRKLIAGMPPANAGEEKAFTQITQLDIPGYQNRNQGLSGPGVEVGGRVSYHQPLISTNGTNGIGEFAINFANEMVASYVTRRTFEDDHGSVGWRMRQDGLSMPEVSMMDNTACMELLRGGPVSSANQKLAINPRGLLGLMDRACTEAKARRSNGDRPGSEQDEQLKRDMTQAYGVHGSFMASPPALGMDASSRTSMQSQSSESRRHLFGINHYSGACVYDVEGFIDGNKDIIDSQLVGLLRASDDSFIAKLVSGPSIAAESHPMDANTIVQSQVSVTPLRRPTAAHAANDEPILDGSRAYPITTQSNVTLTDILSSMERAKLWNVLCVRPNDSGHANSFDKRRIKSQIRSFHIPDLLVRNQNEYVADIDKSDFAKSLGLQFDGSDILLQAIAAFTDAQGWDETSDFAVGSDRIWLSYASWKQYDDLVRVRQGEKDHVERSAAESSPGSPSQPASRRASVYADSNLGTPDYPIGGYGGSTDDLLISKAGMGRRSSRSPFGSGTGRSPGNDEGSLAGDRDQTKYMEGHALPSLSSGLVVEKDFDDRVDYGNKTEAGLADMVVRDRAKAHIEMVPTTSSRRWWVRIVWTLTWWIPNFLLSSWGRMKRPDVRMAWREKLAIFMMIIGLCGTVVFYIVAFGKLLCPNSDKAWNTSELAEHTGTNDYYAAIAGKVYDFTNFYKGQHSDIAAYPTTSAIMLEFAGLDLTDYFPMPFTVACAGLVTSTSLYMQRANFTPIVDYAVHTSGPLQTTNGTELNSIDWYESRLSPYVEQYYKGQFVWDISDVQKQADDGTKTWFIYDKSVYDLSDYFYTITYYASSSGEGVPNYSFLNSSITDTVKNQPGQDLTKALDAIYADMSSSNVAAQKTCLQNAFFLGATDFRKTARCLVQNYLLLAFSILLMSTIAAKFFAALQFGGKRNPELLDKFVVCQVPCYTEGEESLRRTIDSLAALQYDDKRKLMLIICDGNIIGSGNDRPTPRIVLDILGVDPKVDPEPLMFKSVGEGAKQLNYGKVYSGLYEFEGHVVPYMVVVKVGKPSERSKPGNRGKRDSQVLLLHYLNRVHFDAPMNPLELEMYHQMRNVIGIDPAFYEYIFQVDADTTVTPESLNRMIACTSDDSKIIGICGETKLANERQSLTTMIQVYEYYISHHLTKAFESLFGSVTCLPGCFSVYRIRTADKGRPIIISSRVIDEYAEPNVDTLHKKNLFSLGEDRYLTTLMMKHFPTYKMKFTADAIAHTVAPDKWAVLLSQRRRWINSTIHNLVELLFLPEMCGFCFFSMRFFVFVDLLGTIILPASCVYLVYLIVVVSTGKAAIPIISLAMIGAVYGLQALIFLLKREFQLIGWMVLYILAFPIYSFFLPLYSFWHMDDHSWGNTRIIEGEGREKKIIADVDDCFDDSMIPLKRFSGESVDSSTCGALQSTIFEHPQTEYEAETWETASGGGEKYDRETDNMSQTTAATKDDPYRRRRTGMSDSKGPGAHPSGGDFYRDSSPLGRSSPSGRNLRTMPSESTINTPHGANPRVQSMAGLSQWGPGSFYGSQMVLPQLQNPFMGSMAGSEYGAMPPSISGTGYGMPGMGGPPRNSMLPIAPSHFETGPVLNGNVGDLTPGGRPDPFTFARPHSTFSMATTFNPFEAPPPPPNIDYSSPSPSDNDIIQFLSYFLATQDLMAVTKRKVREAVFAKFVNANLGNRTTFINENIDRLLSG